MSWLILEEPAAVQDQSVMVAPREMPQEDLDMNAEAFDFITRHVLETDAIIFEG
jgi:hypothetical protein